MTTPPTKEIHPAVLRAQAQIALRKRLVQQLRGYASWDHCGCAAHFLLPDGGAASQGHDPRGLAWMPGIAHLVPRMIQIEADAVFGWTGQQAAEVVARLRERGREEDARRITDLFFGVHPDSAILRAASAQ